MWVLEARKDAEKVWFPVVWEEKKDASNIIDYDIHEEITIDTISVFNANNDTTTGMATVIPWVNAPKLKLSTSVYIDKLEIPTVNLVLTATWSSIARPDETSTMINNMTVSNDYWTDTIEYYSSPKWYYYSWMKIPLKWRYQFDVTYPWTWTTYWWTFQWRTPRWWWSDDIIWKTYTTVWSYLDEEETFVRDFEKWELFCIFASMDRTSPTPITTAPVVTMKVTKL